MGEEKIEELTNALEEVTKRNTRSHIKNDEMRRRLHELQAYYGILEDDEEDISSEHEDFEQEDVYKWGMEKVLAWWRRNLPKSAQTYITMVRECQMTGTDLLELDMGMLQQFSQPLWSLTMAPACARPVSPVMTPPGLSSPPSLVAQGTRVSWSVWDRRTPMLETRPSPRGVSSP